MLELVIALAAFAIGLSILALLGFTNAIDEWNSETVVLIGVLAIIVVIGIIIGIVALIKKGKNKCRRQQSLLLKEKP